MYAHISKDKKMVVVSSISLNPNNAARWLTIKQAQRLLRQLQIAIEQVESTTYDSPSASA